MRLAPASAEIIILIAAWTAALLVIRQERKHVVVARSLEVRSHRFQAAGVICATAGLTFFIGWLLTDSPGLQRLHIIAEPAALIALATAAVLSGYGTWVQAR
jgi:hypothetical protein